MTIEIRKVEDSDFDQLYELFEKRKSRDLLKWIYDHPCAEGHNGYVALENKKIIGVVGFVRSEYYINGEIKKGLIPLSWEVAKEKRGFVGIKLLYKVLNDADFYLGMDGSEDMRQIFKGMQFNQVGEGIGAKKVLLPYKYLKTLNKVGFKDILRFFSDLPKKAIKRKSNISINLISDYKQASIPENSQIIFNILSKQHLDWLTGNPGMTTYLFEAEINGFRYAPIVLFAKEIKNGIKRGQIVHIPPLSKDDAKYYKDIIISIENFFIKKKITATSVLVSNPELKEVFKSLHYRFDTKIRPIVAKGSKEIIEKLNNSIFHLSFAESDKSVRNI